MREGTVAADGPIRNVIAEYLNAMSDHRTARAEFAVDPSKPCQFLSAAILRQDGTLGSELGCDEPFVIRLELEVRRPIPNLRLYFDLYTMEGVRLLCSEVRDGDPSIIERLGVGRHTFEIPVPSQLLGAMTYLLNIGCQRQSGEPFDHHQACCELRSATR